MSIAYRIRRLAVTLGLGYLALVGTAYLLQGCMIHMPHSDLVAEPTSAGLAFEDVTLTTEDGEQLHGWFVPAHEPRGVLLFFHGNAGNISHRLTSIGQFHDLNLDVLIIDYRGYGQSSGRPSEQGLYRDADAALRHLVDERDYDPARIVAFGRSLGGAVAAELASREPLGALIVESAFTSIPDIGSDLYPFLPVRWLTRYRYDTRKAIEQVSAPVLVVHSPDDEIIPFAHGQALFGAASEPKELLRIQGQHNTGFMTSGEIYTGGIRRFLDAHL